MALQAIMTVVAQLIAHFGLSYRAVYFFLSDVSVEYCAFTFGVTKFGTMGASSNKFLWNVETKQ